MRRIVIYLSGFFVTCCITFILTLSVKNYNDYIIYENQNLTKKTCDMYGQKTMQRSKKNKPEDGVYKFNLLAKDVWGNSLIAILKIDGECHNIIVKSIGFNKKSTHDDIEYQNIEISNNTETSNIFKRFKIKWLLNYLLSLYLCLFN